VIFAESPGIVNAEPSGFRAAYAPCISFSAFGQALHWYPAQLRRNGLRAGDVLVLEWNMRVLSTPLALLFSRLRRIRVLLWGHGYSHGSESRLKGAVRCLLATIAHGVIYYDEAQMDSCPSLAYRRRFLAPNAIDTEAVALAASTWTAALVEDFRSDHNLSDAFVVLHVSRLIPERRLDVLIRAVSILRDHGVNVTVVIIGDGPEREGLRHITTRLHLKKHVLFLDPMYREDELAPWFLAADCACFPAGGGLGINHALAYGLPVVRGDDDRAHWPEASNVKPGFSGLVFRSNDPVSLATTLRTVYEQPELRRRLATGALYQGRIERSLDRMVAGLAEAILGEN